MGGSGSAIWHPGTYRLTALRETPDSVALFGSMPVVITDRDRRDVHLRAGQAQPLPGRVVWDGTPPTLSERRSITVRLNPLNRGVFPSERLEAQAGIPDSFVLGRVLLDDYAVVVSGVPGNLSVKEISYAGRNVLHEPMRLSSGPATGASRRPRARRGLHPCPGEGSERETRARAVAPLHLPGQRRFRGRSGGVAGIRRDRPAGPTLRALPPGRYRAGLRPRHWTAAPIASASCSARDPGRKRWKCSPAVSRESIYRL